MISSALGRTAEEVQPVVARGWITLEGTVQTQVVRSAVHCVARSVSGARGVTDRVEVRAARHSRMGSRRIW